MYGPEADSGVMLITTKHAAIQQLTFKKESKKSLKVYGTKEEPLILMDGKEISNKEFELINPQQIESISILKDADSAKQYGEKSKHGVVLITTKRKK
ncbi:MAG: TonB-dependent receptor plug domain-containing protein [Tannerellaceae bacterium]|nr:TonB-dependent receptor plug domain-containing protein [Tannerellaceae bacterium]